jgi:hypothetical protein
MQIPTLEILDPENLNDYDPPLLVDKPCCCNMTKKNHVQKSEAQKEIGDKKLEELLKNEKESIIFTKSGELNTQKDK